MSDNVKRYMLAVVVSAATLGAVLLLGTVLPFEPFLLFAIPVAVTSRYAGRGPTVVTVFLSIAAISLALFDATGMPPRSMHSGRELWLHALLFGIVALAIDSTTEALRKARTDAERSAQRLEDANVELEQQMDQIQMLSEDLHRTNLSLEIARDKAEDASRAREDMLGVVAHDLRNPLNLLMMTTELLGDAEPSKEKTDQLLGVMQRATRRMNRLIDDLLEVVRQESGRMMLDLGETSAASLLAQTAEMFQSAAQEKGVTLRVDDCPPDVLVNADAERIVQVLSNLVGNAVKFVPAGGSVSLKCESSGNEAVFSVTDSGPGLDPDDLSRLFEKFWQRRRSDKRGVGLGLAIAKGIVEAHGGRIWAESKLGVGSTFYFALPAVIPNGVDRRAAAAPHTDATLPELRVPAPV